MSFDDLIIGLMFGAYLVGVAMLIGSFINLAADRLPRGESLVRPRSHCRSCRRELDAIDLVPVAGYLIRAGKCATCGARIGVSSLVVEAACGASMAAALIAVGGVFGAGLGFLAVTSVGFVAVGVALSKAEAGAP